MMEILRGSPALSAFRINKLLARFQAARLPVHTIYAEYVHFADLNAPLNDDEHAQLERLLKYGPALASHAPQGKLLLVTPRPGTISPWSSKATDIAHNCGLQQVNRLERGVAYYIETGLFPLFCQQDLPSVLYQLAYSIVVLWDDTGSGGTDYQCDNPKNSIFRQ